jgi:predicted nucleotidyltransferase
MEAKEMKYIEELFSTNVGSHMWHMDHPGSDIDLFIAVRVPTHLILRGEFNDRSRVEYSGELDKQYHEIGGVINQLLKNNWNYLSGVMSPIVVKKWEHLSELQRLTKMNYSKMAYHSIKGLAEHNYKKYVVNERDDSIKRCNTIARTVLMGCKLLREGKLEFNPVTATSPKDIPKFISELDMAYKESSLPETPQYADDLREFLYSIRMEELRAWE